MKLKRVLTAMAFLSIGLISACGGGGGGGGNSGTVSSGAKTTAQTAHDGTTESMNAAQNATQMASQSQIQLTSLVGQVSSGCSPSCSVSTDLSGFSAPTSSAPQFKPARFMDALRAAYPASKPSPTMQNSYVAGCVHATGTNTGVFERAGHGTCQVSGAQIEINYHNGDKVEYTWDCSGGNGCSTTMQVVGGHYSGTYIKYSLDWNNFYIDITTTARIQYDDIINYDRCLDQDWHVTWSADNQSNLTIATTTEFVNIGEKYRVKSDLTYEMLPNSDAEIGGWTLSGNSRWADIAVSQTLAMLCTAGTYSENGHVLEYNNMNVTESWIGNPPTMTANASGVVDYDNAEIGHFEPGDYGLVQIRWNDGTTTPFDPWENMWTGFMVIFAY